MPEVTVLMAVYNGERHIRPAIDSILSQTLRDFELLIVDDGSTDRTVEIVSSYTDQRIRLIRRKPNAGLSAALNEGVRLAQAPLVARHDADDLSEPTRLAQQCAAMNARPEIALIGTQGIAVSEDGVPTGPVSRPVAPDTIRWVSVFDNPFIHTSVMFRTDVVRRLGGFNAAYDPFSQDYDLWCRLMEQHAVANLPDALVRYRVTDSSIIGALDSDGPSNDYRRRFETIVRDLTARQARRVFGADALSEAEAPLTAGLVLGVDRGSLRVFLSLFERLLAMYCERYPDCASEDFRRALARQIDALVFRVRPATRASTAAIYMHLLRYHADAAASVSWSRGLAQLLFGKSGRDTLARWKRRHSLLAKG